MYLDQQCGAHCSSRLAPGLNLSRGLAYGRRPGFKPRFSPSYLLMAPSLAVPPSRGKHPRVSFVLGGQPGEEACAGRGLGDFGTGNYKVEKLNRGLGVACGVWMGTSREATARGPASKGGTRWAAIRVTAISISRSQCL